MRAAYETARTFVPREILTDDGTATLISISSYAEPDSKTLTQKKHILQNAVFAHFDEAGLGHETGR